VVTAAEVGNDANEPDGLLDAHERR
jgi:hypothetical protein